MRNKVVKLDEIEKIIWTEDGINSLENYRSGWKIFFHATNQVL